MTPLSLTQPRAPTVRLLYRTAAPPNPLFGLRALAGLGDPPRPLSPPSDLPNLFWLKNRLK